jgi:hypothetical protein
VVHSLRVCGTRYEYPSTNRDHSDESLINVSEELVFLLVAALESLRTVNREKANQLVVAALCQLVAILTLGGTVIAIVA